MQFGMSSAMKDIQLVRDAQVLVASVMATLPLRRSRGANYQHRRPNLSV